jgi:Ran GTPase-activating protein (RanGAP) involved in mRNA processing and transport
MKSKSARRKLVILRQKEEKLDSNASFVRVQLVEILPPRIESLRNNVPERCNNSVDTEDMSLPSTTCTCRSINIMSGSSVDLSFKALGDFKGAHAVAEAIQRNQAITSLDLSRNGIASAGASRIAECLYSLAPRHSLRLLDLSFNRMGPACLPALTGLLGHNSSLQAMDLGFNDLGPSGASSIRDALMRNHPPQWAPLQRLSLARNNLGEEGCTHMAEALRINTSLQYLNLRQNCMRAGESNSVMV